MSRHKLNELMSSYKSSYTLPKFPKTCPECGHKVKVFHMNILKSEENSVTYGFRLKQISLTIDDFSVLPMAKNKVCFMNERENIIV